jgi:dienelactone hydrolase
MFSGLPRKRWNPCGPLRDAAALGAALGAAAAMTAAIQPAPAAAGTLAAAPAPGGASPQAGMPAVVPAANVRRFVIPSSSRPLDAAYFSNRNGARGRAVLVVNANGFPLESLDGFARLLAAKGYSVLTVQNPAFPLRIEDSNGRQRFDPHGLKNSNLPDKAEDLRNAIRFLQSEPTADASAFTLVGVGLGANLAAVLAAREEHVASVVFVAPGKSCDPKLMLPYLAAIHPRPSLLVARENDAEFRAAFAAADDAERTVIEVPSDAPELSGEAVNAGGVSRMDDIAAWLAVHAPPSGREGPPARTGTRA